MTSFHRFPKAEINYCTFWIYLLFHLFMIQYKCERWKFTVWMCEPKKKAREHQESVWERKQGSIPSKDPLRMCWMQPSLQISHHYSRRIYMIFVVTIIACKWWFGKHDFFSFFSPSLSFVCGVLCVASRNYKQALLQYHHRMFAFTEKAYKMWKFIQNFSLSPLSIVFKSIHRFLVRLLCWFSHSRFHSISLIRISIYRLIFIIISSWYSFSFFLFSHSLARSFRYSFPFPPPPIGFKFSFVLPTLDTNE